MIYVSVKTKIGTISLGQIDDNGRLVYLAGYWMPSKDPDKLDETFRRQVEEIIYDDGVLYEKMLGALIY
jgi:hypothetical protein